MPKENRFAAAFKESGNLVGLTAAFAVSVAALNPLPLFVGIVAEACYLLFVPDSKWFSARLSRKYDADIVRRRQLLRDQTFPQLEPEMQERFVRMEAMRRQIDTQSKSDEKWFREILRQLDYLLEKCLLFASKEAQFRSYLSSVWQESRSTKDGHGSSGDHSQDTSYFRSQPTIRSGTSHQMPASTPPPLRGAVAKWVPGVVSDVQSRYQVEIDKLQESMKAESDDNTKAVMQKRIDVLHQRQEFVAKIGRILTNLNYQLELLEDTFGLINDQIRARSPEQVLSDIEGVVDQTESMTQLLDELAPYEQMANNLAA